MMALTVLMMSSMRDWFGERGVLVSGRGDSGGIVDEAHKGGIAEMFCEERIFGVA